MGRISTGNQAFICAVCGSAFRSYLKRRVYCSRACMTADYRRRFASEGNPAWRGGAWKYKGRGWASISAEIIARDKACADCGAADDLIAHHLIPQRFWRDLDAANTPDNLIALCNACHVRRPEHYWVTVPLDRLDPTLHVAGPAERTKASIRPYPACVVCGQPCKRHRSRFCSYACSNRARWQSGIYEGIVRNLGDPATARWGGAKVV